MNFEVNGIPYFLTFDSRVEQWCLLTPARDGVEFVEIHNDGALLTAPLHPSWRGGGAPRTN
jgi:hypothetical protein